MRFLFTSIPGFGHFYPIVPLAKALEAAGHDVAVVTAPAFSEAVTRTGIEFIPGGLDWSEVWLADTLPEIAAIPEERHGGWLMNRIFLDRSPRQMIPALMDIIPQWKPDVVVSGTYEFGGPLAAEKSGLPYANVSISLRWSRWVLKHMVGKSITKLRSEFDLTPDKELAAIGRYLDLCFVPPSWDLTTALLHPGLSRLVAGKLIWSDLPLAQRLYAAQALALQGIFKLNQRFNPSQGDAGPTTHFIGPEASGQEEPARPAWLDAMPDQPTLFVSLGTVFGAQYPQVFDTILSGLRDMPVNIVIATGENTDIARFGTQPPNVRIERFLPRHEMQALLHHADLCINHGGFGTVMETLAQGVPQVILPLATDQPLIALMCLANGVGPELPAKLWRLSGEGLPIVRIDRLTPDIIRDAVKEALGNPSYRAAAQLMKAEVTTLPRLDRAVTLLEKLATSGSTDRRAP